MSVLEVYILSDVIFMRPQGIVIGENVSTLVIITLTNCLQITWPKKLEHLWSTSWFFPAINTISEALNINSNSKWMAKYYINAKRPPPPSLFISNQIDFKNLGLQTH